MKPTGELGAGVDTYPTGEEYNDNDYTEEVDTDDENNVLPADRHIELPADVLPPTVPETKYR